MRLAALLLLAGQQQPPTIALSSTRRAHRASKYEASTVSSWATAPKSVYRKRTTE